MPAARMPALPPSSSPETSPPAALLSAWLTQSHDLLALTDAAGRLAWANPAFERATGLGVPADLLGLAPDDWHAGAPRAALSAAFGPGLADDTELALRSAAGATLRVQARVACVGAQWLWTFRDITAQRELAARAQHLSELLEMAQEFGRIGVWEREIPSGAGRWDRHVFNFWGIEPSAGMPDLALATERLHPEDRNSPYLESTRRAGRYVTRYRVIHPDGRTRWLQSQWEVKNSPQGQPDRAIGIVLDDTDVYELARSRNDTAAQLKLATELADIVIWRHDLKTDRVHYNDHGFTVLGIPYSATGLTIAEARSYTHPDDVTKLAATTAQVLATGVPIDVEVRHRRSDGAWRYILVRRMIERDSSGETVAFIGVSLDVTEQAEHSRRAEQLARRLEAAAEAAHIGIWTTTLGTVQTEWNAQMYELFDMVGALRPPTLAEWISQCVHPDDAARVTQVTHAYLKRDPEAFELEFRTRRRDGRIRWMVLRADMDRSSTDATRIFGIALDVTDRHDALNALHTASERSALIARHAGIGTWETDDEGESATWDEQMFRLRGLPPRARVLDREERLALLHPDDRALVIDALPGRTTAVPATAYEFRVRLPDGSYRWLASRSAALRDDQGRVVRRVGVNWDITEARNAELARQHALLAERESQAKSQFLSRMSHELRTPLNAVLGFTQLLQIEALDRPGSGQATKLDHIRAAGEHLLTLIDDALDLSSLQSGTLKLELQPIAIAAAVAQALPLVAEIAAAHGVLLQPGRLDGVVLADATRLRQVLLNLLTNAIKYNRPGGRVMLHAVSHGAHVELQVRDTGWGMRPEQLAHLFEPFNRLGREREGIEGSGIGLTIVKALVEGMGGQIRASSEPGHGTVFELSLPAAAQPAVAGTAAGAAAVAPERLTRLERSGQVLYIEDNHVNVLLVEELVKSLSGLRIVSESSGAEGVARARSLLPDLVLIDLHLPDFDGFEVLRRLRADPATAHIPCIALSANAMPDDIHRGLASGFDDYWTKPIKFKPFLDALDRLFPVRSE